MTTLVLFLEEESAKAMLQGLLPRLIGSSIPVQYVVFEGKQDLENQLPRKLRAWNKPDCRFVVLRDKDSGDCILIKRNLSSICQAAGKPGTMVRIAIHELESWYLGDLQAVEIGLNIRNLSGYQLKRIFRDPDSIVNPVFELRQITNQIYQKVSGSRAIGPHLDLNGNKSRSFQKFVTGIRALISTP